MQEGQTIPETLWIFGYGSLIWHPGFTPATQARARLAGWHRSFCMHSVHYRGTAQAPGLVLALDAAPGAVCDGLAFTPRPGEEAEVLAALRARELISSAYLERELTLRLEDGRTVTAISYVIDREHPQYCGGLSLEQQAQVIARARGARGTNAEYLFSTAAHLTELGLPDADLDWLSARVRALIV
jgi:cation transport protein ChaC